MSSTPTYIWHCENDPAATKVLAHHWPETPNLGDITRARWDHIEHPDILCGGYPCQPFSTASAGRRKGQNDQRDMWPWFAATIRDLRPRLVVLENVAAHRTLGFGSVLSDLATSRYDTQWWSLRASDAGAPHIRERLFAIATDTGRDRRPQRPQPHTNHHITTQQRHQPHRPAVAESTGLAEDWGRYANAIRHWERLTRPAPPATERTRNGNPRPNPRFSEWLMGWPDGWVTDVDITRAEQLRLIGNGCVPQQAEVALRFLAQRGAT